MARQCSICHQFDVGAYPCKSTGGHQWMENIPLETDSAIAVPSEYDELKQELDEEKDLAQYWKRAASKHEMTIRMLHREIDKHISKENALITNLEIHLSKTPCNLLAPCTSWGANGEFPSKPCSEHRLAIECIRSVKGENYRY